MKTHEDQLDALIARVENRLTSFEANVAHMKCKLSEIRDIQDDLSSDLYETFPQAI